MLLIKNGYIKTMAGSDIPNGCILADNGKILAVGSDLKAPEGGADHRRGRTSCHAGCVDAHCHIGLDNERPDGEGMGYNES